MTFEFFLLLFFFYYKKDALIPVFYSLLIFRVIDIFAVFVFICISDGFDVYFLLFMIALLFILWLAVFAFNPLILRARKKILAHKIPFIMDVQILKYLTVLQRSIGELAWGTPGTLSIVIIMTTCAWALEWAAIFLLVHSAHEAASIIVTRIAGSVGFSMPIYDHYPYTELVYIIYAIIPVFGAWYLYSKRKGKR